MSRLLMITAITCAASCAGSPPAETVPQPRRAAIEDLGWLSGRWVMQGDTVGEEHWSTPEAGTMAGANTSAPIGASSVSRELLLVVDEGDGLVYRAWPQNQSPTSFRLVELDESSVAFENPRNEFPQRIEYRRKGNALWARISGTERGEARSIEWRFVRAEPGEHSGSEASSVTTTTAKRRVVGVGGIFFKSKDPEKMRAWYAKHLGLVTNEYGSLFEFRTTEPPQEKAYLQWSPFSQKTKYFEPSAKPFMINYRVSNLEGLLDDLRAGGVQIVDKVAEYEYGKFVHIMDPEGNKIELWEPVDSVFTRLYDGKTTH